MDNIFFIKNRSSTNAVSTTIDTLEDLISTVTSLTINEYLIYKLDEGVFVNISNILSDINIHKYLSLEDFLNDQNDIAWNSYVEDVEQKNSVTVHDLIELKDVTITTDTIDDGMVSGNMGIIDNPEITYNQIILESPKNKTRLPGLILVINGKALKKDINDLGTKAIFYTEGNLLSWQNHVFIDTTDVGGYTKGIVENVEYKPNMNSILVTSGTPLNHKPWLAFNDIVTIPHTSLYNVIRATSTNHIYLDVPYLKYLYRKRFIDDNVYEDNRMEYMVTDLIENLRIIIPNQSLHVTTKELEKHEYLIRYTRDKNSDISGHSLNGLLLINGQITPYRRMELRWKFLDDDKTRKEIESFQFYTDKNSIGDNGKRLSEYNPNLNTNDLLNTHIHPNTKESIVIVEITN